MLFVLIQWDFHVERGISMFKFQVFLYYEGRLSAICKLGLGDIWFVMKTLDRMGVPRSLKNTKINPCRATFFWSIKMNASRIISFQNKPNFTSFCLRNWMSDYWYWFFLLFIFLSLLKIFMIKVSNKQKKVCRETF